tara:strand:+ start:253156 stop:254538 length:1383 start_codon:yes stop_codon:yes gene_type:complete
MRQKLLGSVFVPAICSLLLIGDRPSYSAQVRLDVGATNPTMLADQKETNYIRISLEGFDLAEQQSRPPVNVALVIDTSGSMNGQKIAQARDAAIAAVRRLRDNDIVSVVLYHSSVQVLVPATKATDRDAIIRQIRGIRANGSTALFAGVSKGAAEIRKFLDSESVNRVILLSDGKANVGPKSPRELERLGASFVKEGISVSTLGLGLQYNEDLMSGLASAGSGNHLFVEEADDLVAVFNNEFNDLMSVVAGEFKILAKVGPGVRPVRVLGTKADIDGSNVSIPLTQLYARQERYFVLEVEVDAGEAGTSRPLVDVSVQYMNLVSETTDKLSSSVMVKFSDEVAQVKDDVDLETYAYCAIQIANDKNGRATLLRDAGRIGEAKELLGENAEELKRLALKCVDNNLSEIVPELQRNAVLNQSQAVSLEDASNWSRTRKAMKAEQNANAAQQSSRGYDYSVKP